ncbi:MAG: hypothetical protein AB1817_18330, partial [Chloroflexota bacterium]
MENQPATAMLARADTVAAHARQMRARRIVGHVIGRILIHATLILLSLMAIVPVLWMISSSLKASTEVFAVPMQWLPETPRWANYSDAFERAP